MLRWIINGLFLSLFMTNLAVAAEVRILGFPNFDKHLDALMPSIQSKLKGITIRYEIE